MLTTLDPDPDRSDPRPDPDAERAAALRRWDRRALLVVLFLLLIAASPAIAWLLTPRTPLSALIVDMTVPHRNYREHAGLFWWLNHRRYATPGGAPWVVDADYLGFDPDAHRGSAIDSAHLAGHRLLYIADAYGVYSGDYLFHARERATEDTSQTGLERSRLLYGGISVAEAATIAQFQRGGGSVVAEFNTIESPTSDTSAEDTLAVVVGARYANWLGRWYGDLASRDEIPEWLRAQYARYAGVPWTFRGAGLVFLSDSSDRIAVVPSNQFAQMNPVTIEVERAADPLVAGVTTGQPYWYWFSGVEPLPDSDVLASFVVHVNSGAATTLRAAGFPLRFPARS